VGKPLGKWSQERPIIRWVGNIKMDHTEIGYEDGRWMEMVQD
jgi:hypothetical protein